MLLQLLRRDLEQPGKENTVLALAAEVLQLRPSCLATVQVCDRASGAPREPTSARRPGPGGSWVWGVGEGLQPQPHRSPHPLARPADVLLPLLLPRSETNRHCLWGSRFEWLPGPGTRAPPPPLLSVAGVGSPASVSVAMSPDLVQDAAPHPLPPAQTRHFREIQDWGRVALSSLESGFSFDT